VSTARTAPGNRRGDLQRTYEYIVESRGLDEQEIFNAYNEVASIRDIGKRAGYPTNIVCASN